MEKVKELREKVGRIGGFAMLDVGLTIASAAAIHKYANMPFSSVLILLWFIGEGFHLSNNVDTPITIAIRGSVEDEVKEHVKSNRMGKLYQSRLIENNFLANSISHGFL